MVIDNDALYLKTNLMFGQACFTKNVESKMNIQVSILATLYT